MSPIQGTAALMLVMSLSATSFTQTIAPRSLPSSYVPRHERVAASVLRRQNSPMTMAANTMAANTMRTDAIPPVPPSASDLNASRATSTAVNTQTRQASQGIPGGLGDADYPMLPPEFGSTGVVGSSPAVGYSSGDHLVDYSASGVGTTEYGTGVEFSGAPSFPVGGGCNGGCGACADCATGVGFGGTGGYCWVDTFSLSLGVQSHTNPLNRGQSGSFGFQQGVNFGSPRQFTPWGLNGQLGLRTTQSNLNGAVFEADHQSQLFVTAGLFKRAVAGWQGGLVYDYLREEWYNSLDLGQLRGELSLAVPNGSSFGFWFATSVAQDTDTFTLSGQAQTETWETHDLYALFYRAQSNMFRGGQWRVYGGVTGGSDGLIGSDFRIPLAGLWSLEPQFTYVIPDEATGAGGSTQESWNIAINLVWYPGRGVNGLDFQRLPMFDVADNGSMITYRPQP